MIRLLSASTHYHRIGLLLVILALARPAWAQEPEKDKEIVALKAEIAELRKIQAPMLAAAQLKATQAALKANLLNLRTHVEPACKAVHGKLAFTFNGSGQITTVTCTVK